MASRSDIQAGKAHIELYVKNSALVKGLKAAQQSLQGLGTKIATIGAGMTALGGAIVAPIAAAITHFVKFGSELNDMSARTGVAASSLAEMKFAAEQTGASLEDVETGLRKMAKEGHNVKDFDKIAAAITAIEDPSERAAMAMEIFGKSGTKLIPMLANLKALRQEARDAGLVPSDEAVSVADALGDAFDKIRAQATSALFEIGAAVGPVLLPALKIVSNIAAATIRWVKENQAVVRMVAAVGAGLMVAGTIVTGIGAAIFGVGAAFGAVATILTTLAGFIASPLGITVALVAALGLGAAAWLRFTVAGRTAVAGIMVFLGPLLETLKTTIGGIADALMGGQIQLAGQIAVTGLKLIFMQGVQQIVTGIGGIFGAFFGSVANDLIRGDFQGAWDTVVRAMATAWDAFASSMVTVFVSAVNAIRQAWNSLTAGMAVTLGGIEVAMGALPGGFGKATASAMAAARAGLGATGGAIGAGLGVTGSALSAVEEAMKKRAEASAGNFGRGLGADAAGNAAEVARLEAELQRLHREAAAAAEGKKATSPDLPDGSELKQRVAVGFSAAGLGLQLQGGGTGDKQERIARAVEKANKKQDDLIGAVKEIKPAVWSA